MLRPAIQMWPWRLFVLLCLAQALLLVHATGPPPQNCGPTPKCCGIKFFVAIPAVLKAGGRNRFCVGLLQPLQDVRFQVILKSKRNDKILLNTVSWNGFGNCLNFKVPSVPRDELRKVKVVIKSYRCYISQTKKVLIKVYKPRTFIQTDKPKYQPGETVHFRILTLNAHLKAPKIQYDPIVIKDPSHNKIARWRRRASKGTILQLSHCLSSEARQGLYNIIVKTDKHKVRHSFRVQRYVLPKFEVKVSVPKVVSVGQRRFEVVVCAKYKHGKPVQGKVKVKVCRPLMGHNYCSSAFTYKNYQDYGRTPPCEAQSKKLGRSGCTHLRFKISTFTRTNPKALLDKLHVSATVEEKGTCISYTKLKKIKLSYVIGRLKFINVPEFYSTGQRFTIKVKAVTSDGGALADFPVFPFLVVKDEQRFLGRTVTNKKGFGTFQVQLSGVSGRVALKVSDSKRLRHPGFKTPFYEGDTAEMDVVTPGPAVANFLRVSAPKKFRCGKMERICIQYSIRGRTSYLPLFWIVLARGKMIDQGFRSVRASQTVNKGEKCFTLKVTPQLAPHIRIVAFFGLQSMDMLAYSAEFPTTKCFKNKVQLKLKDTAVVPGEYTKIWLKAHPESWCGLSIVDKRNRGKALNAQKIFQQLQLKKAYFPNKLDDFGECLRVRPRRDTGSSVFTILNQDRDDAYTAFKNIGIQILTNFVIQNPRCLKLRQMTYFKEQDKVKKPKTKYSKGANIASLAKDPTLCSDSEQGELVHAPPHKTWLFQLAKIGRSGKKDLHLIVPEHSKTWRAEAFCVGDGGFGLSSHKRLKVVQPFSVHLDHPGSIILMESFLLRATVSKNSKKCHKIKVTLSPCSYFTTTLLASHTFCLCKNNHKTVEWTVTPTALGPVKMVVTAEAVLSNTRCGKKKVVLPQKGRVNTETGTVIVETQGTEISKTSKWLLCPKGHCLKKSLQMTVPRNAIPKSVFAKVTVKGDLMAMVPDGIDKLLQNPTESGEKNIALMAANIHIMDYLKKTKQLTAEMREKMVKSLSFYYQKQLLYKTEDGAFSTFESGQPNTCLTAFVMATLHKARAYTYIDPKVIQNSRKWLKCQQRDNGCFKVSGRFYNNGIRGCVSDEVINSACIINAFLEMKISAKNAVVKKGLQCLKESVTDFSNTYVTAMLAYTFSRAEDVDTSAHLLHYLDSVAKSEGHHLYWSQPGPKASTFLSVGITSYVVLAKLCKSLSPDALYSVSKVIPWLIEQQQYHGGFETPQDTVLALQALGRYSFLVFSDKGSSRVKVTSPLDHLVLHVNPDNRLHQEAPLHVLKGKHHVRVDGSACVSVQISLNYIIPSYTRAFSHFSVDVDVKCKPNSDDKKKIILNLKSLYRGDGGCTNMAILDIEIPSGYIPCPRSLRNLRSGQQVEHIEHKDRHLYLYLRELCKDIAVYHVLELFQEHVVLHLKPSRVRLYDNQHPWGQAVTEYRVSGSNSARPHPPQKPIARKNCKPFDYSNRGCHRGRFHKKSKYSQ